MLCASLPAYSELVHALLSSQQTARHTGVLAVLDGGTLAVIVAG